MTIREAASALTLAICGGCLSFRPGWFQMVGIREYHDPERANDLVCYVLGDLARAERELRRHCPDLTYEGYAVEPRLSEPFFIGRPE